MNKYDEIKKMIEISRQYYIQNLTQSEIAKNFNISRPSISRLIQKAHDEGIVQINIIDPFSSITAISESLKEKLNINKVIVIPSDNSDPVIIRNYLAYATGDYLGTNITRGDIIGIGFGQTLFRISKILQSSKKQDVTFIPLVGGIGQVDPNFQVHNIVHNFGEAFGGTIIQYFVPGVVESKGLHDELRLSADYKLVKNYWRKMTKAIVGVGGNPQNSNALSQKMKKDLKEISPSPVSDICMRMFDINGNLVDYLSNNLLSISLESLKMVPEVIAVCGGSEKVDGIIGASRGKLIDTLITDRFTATMVIKKLEKIGKL